jgi:hypothetical protein
MITAKHVSAVVTKTLRHRAKRHRLIVRSSGKKGLSNIAHASWSGLKKMGPEWSDARMPRSAFMKMMHWRQWMIDSSW